MRGRKRLASFVRKALGTAFRPGFGKDTSVAAKIKALPAPNKSKSDHKDYRSFELTNGLRVLLIADTRYPLSKLDEEEKFALPSDGEDDEDDDDMDVEIEVEQAKRRKSSTMDFSTHDSDSDDSDSDSDADSMAANEEEDEIETIAMKRAKTFSGLKCSAAGLCVGVGSFSDPEDLQGLAHFLEHMVFMGSEKYPDENDFDNFIQKYGGSSNACTDCETTVFYFETQRKYFREGLDRFANLFISPLLKTEAMQREREAVDSEFEMALPSDYNRKEQIFGSLSKSGHPMSKFMWGNLKSLQSAGISDEEIRNRLLEFKKRHYSAGAMTLVVQSQQELDTLQDWVIESFSAVPNGGGPIESHAHLSLPFDTPQFHRLYKFSPIQNTYEVDLNWALPAMMDKYRVKPLNYLSWIIGHEGRGSLISYLRKKVWALDLTAGNGGTGIEFNSTYAGFTITVVLTKSGFQNLEKVLEAVFSYLKMMRRDGPNERIYGEIQKIEDLNFHFHEESQPVDNVETLCENMQLYPPEEYVAGGTLMYDYDESLIEECLSSLRTDNVNVFVMARDYEELCAQSGLEEPWFKTKFASEEVPSSWESAWSMVEPYPEFHLPSPNKFIAVDASLKVIDYPYKLVSEDQGELFYKKDNTFGQPRASLCFHVCSPEPVRAERGAVCLDLLVNCISQLMMEDTYPAALAQLSFACYSGERGLMIKVSGLNDKLLYLLECVLDNFAQFESRITEDLFRAVKEETRKGYFNHFLKPMKLVREIRLSVLQDGYYRSFDKHAVAAEVDLPELLAFLKSFRSNIFVQALVQGNMIPADAREAYDLVKKKLSLEPITGQIPESRCRELPSGRTYIRVESFNQRDGNTVITNYYQMGAGSLRSNAILEVLNMIMEEPLFQTLRTKEQLGYQVFSVVRNTFGVLGLSVTVCSQASKFTPDFVDERIESFLEWFLKEKLGNMTDEEFRSLLETLIRQKKAADVTLHDEVNRHWAEIVAHDYLFDRHVRDIELLESSVTLRDVSECLQKLVVDAGEHYRKLSVQVVGCDTVNDVDEATASVDPDRVFRLKYLPPEEESKSKRFVTDTTAFKKTLPVNPVIRLVN